VVLPLEIFVGFVSLERRVVKRKQAGTSRKTWKTDGELKKDLT
jgi:hypothetical protein